MKTQVDRKLLGQVLRTFIVGDGSVLCDWLEGEVASLPFPVWDRLYDSCFEQLYRYYVDNTVPYDLIRSGTDRAKQRMWCEAFAWEWIAVWAAFRTLRIEVTGIGKVED